MLWSLVGVLALVVGGIWLGLSRWMDDWQGIRFGPGLRYRRGAVGRNQKEWQLRVALEVPTLLDFEVRLETRMDRLAKAVGLSVEIQSGREGFDDDCYLIADRPEVRALLRMHPSLADEIDDSLYGWYDGFSFSGMVCRRGELYVDLWREGADEPEPVQLQDLLALAQQRLQSIAEQLPIRPGEAPRLDPMFARAMLLFAIVGGLSMLGIVELLHADWFEVPITLDNGKLWAMVLPAAALLLLGLLLLALVLVGRSSRTHGVLLQMLCYGGFGLTVGVHGELVDLNRELDDGPAQVQVAQVGDRESHHRRHGDTYFLQLAGLGGGAGLGRLQVSYAVYSRYQTGDCISLRLRPGRLGARWIEDIEPARLSCR